MLASEMGLELNLAAGFSSRMAVGPTWTLQKIDDSEVHVFGALANLGLRYAFKRYVPFGMALMCLFVQACGTGLSKPDTAPDLEIKLKVDFDTDTTCFFALEGVPLIGALFWEQCQCA